MKSWTECAEEPIQKRKKRRKKTNNAIIRLVQGRFAFVFVFVFIGKRKIQKIVA